MDAYEVIKGIEHFFENVIPKAYSSDEWSDDSICNAFHCAKFCEQVYHTYKDKAAKKRIDELLHQITFSYQNNRSICFEDLLKSSNILYEAFLKNPAVEKEKIKLTYLKIKGEDAEEKDIKNINEVDKLCYELIEALKPVKIAKSERSLYCEVKAEIYINLLRDSTLYLTCEEEVEKYLSDALEKLCGNNNETLLLSVLALHVPKGVESSLAEIHEFIINWTILKVLTGENCALGEVLWQNASSLRAISLSSPAFFNFYLDFLTNSAASLYCELEDEDGEMKWISKSSDKKQTLSFDEVLTHFRSLLKEDDDVGESTKEYLLNLLDNHPNVQIYKEIFIRVT